MIRDIIVYINLIIVVIYAQDECQLSNGQIGICVNVQECEPYMRILRGSRPIKNEDLERLHAANCGFDGKTPKVCCNSPSNAPSPANQPSSSVSQQAPIPSSIALEKPLAPTEPPVSQTENTVPVNPVDVRSHPNLRYLNHSICGPITQSKIVGGNKTGVLEFPWMALIAYDTGGRKEFRCGGSIINKRYILTAAHCVTNLGPTLSLYGVRVGEHNLSTERDCDRDKNGLELVCAEGYQDFLYESFIFHPEYSSKTLKNDIAVIRLDADIDFTPLNVKPICLPIGDAAEIRSKKVTVLGWGATDEGPRSEDLLQVKLSLVSNEECAESYGQRAAIWPAQICAGGKLGKDSCLGDSGGPMLAPALYYNDVRYIQYGIVSFGPRQCGTDGVPGVYTRITFYTDWILGAMRD